MAAPATAPARRAAPTGRGGPAPRPKRPPDGTPAGRAGRPRLRTVPEARRRRGRAGRPALIMAAGLAVVSLLAVAGAHAYLTQGQVRLARLQQQLANDVVTHRTLELHVAQLEDPQRIVAEAQQQGLVAPTEVGDLPEVPLSRPLGSSAPSSSAAGTSSAVVPAPAGSSSSGSSSSGSSSSGSSSASSGSSQ